MHERLLDGEGLVHHFIVAGGTPQVRGLLADQSAYARALLDAHEVSGEPRFLQRARALLDRIVDRFEAEDGGFYDRIDVEDAPIGRLEIADRPIVDNGLLAETLLRLAGLTGDPRYREHAERTLTLFARTYAAAGSFGAPYVRALRRYLSRELSVRIVGEAAATGAFREAASRLPAPLATVRTLALAEAAELGLPAEPRPAAYVCSGSACGAPALEAAAMRAAYDALMG